MRIYIDESGNFMPDGTSSRICCEAALVIPDRIADELLSEFVSLRSAWTSEPEIKGSSLSDDQTVAALSLLGRFDVLLEVHAFDVAHNSPAQIAEFQKGQGDAIVAGLTRKHNRNAHRWAHSLRDEWLKLSPQLMAQMYTLVLTVGEVVRHTPNYYSQRMPEEIGRFDWILDPKDIIPTPFELVWQKVVCPFLQTESLLHPMMRVIGFDYSAMDRFQMEIPDYLESHLPKNAPPTGGGAVNLGVLLRESVAFPDSKNEPGLQLVDIAASAFSKAMNGKLPPPVWRLLGPIMLEKPNRAPTARLIALGAGRDITVGNYHTYVLKALRNRAKRMFLQ